MSSYKSDFHKYIMQTLTGEQLAKFETLFSSAKRMNFVLRHPEKAKTEELILIAELFGTTPWSLIQQFSVAQQETSQAEQQYHYNYDKVLSQVAA